MANEINERRVFMLALAINFLWINISEIARYFLVVRPMLQDAFPGQNEIAPMSWSIFALWSIWDVILIVAATGFYYLWLDRFGATFRQVLLSSLGFSVAFFGLIWLGIANMGLAPYSLLFAALPLAWLEQVVACVIVAHCLKRVYSPSSMRSI